MTFSHNVVGNILGTKDRSKNRVTRKQAEEYAEEQHKAFLHQENTKHRRKEEE
jgi:hypothetical protein